MADCSVVGAAPAEVEQALQKASDEADVLIVLGGDGTIRSAAEKVRERKAFLIPLPGGTMNMLPHALYGARDWKAALGDTLANPTVHPVSGGAVGDQGFFCAALFGAPTLWADAREAFRKGHLIDATRKSVTAARRSLSEPLNYEFGSGVRGSAEAVAIVCPLISKVMDEHEEMLEAAAIDTATAGDALRLGLHTVFDDWRNDPAVRRAKVRSATIRGHGSLPITLDGERIKIGRNAQVTFLPLAFRALVPGAAPAL